MKIFELTRKLYRLTGKLNLYIQICCTENKLDTVRIKNELSEIYKTIESIEDELNEF